MESSLLISATTSASDRYGTPQVERTPELSGSRNASGNDIGATVQCERRHCKRLVPRTTVRKVTAQEPNGIKKPMLVCPGCYRHYKDKASTIRTTRSLSNVNLGEIKRNVAASQRGNQSNVIPVPVVKSNQPIVKSPTPTHPSLRTSRRVASDQSLFPSGWAPGPAGEGHPLKLDITLPKENSAPEALKHYARIRDQLRQRVHAGGRDAVVVIVNARLNTHVPGRAKSTIILSESIANVPMRISHGNLQRLMLNAFMNRWLKKFANYPLGTEHIESLRLLKGKNGIHLDNMEHAILEHCLSTDKKKFTAPDLNLMLLLDPDYVDKAQAHRASVHARDASPINLNLDLDPDYNHHSDDSTKQTLLVTPTAKASISGATQSQISTRLRPRARPILKKRKLFESSSDDEQAPIPQDQKCGSSSQTSHVPTGTNAGVDNQVDNLKLALIAQHEPPPADIDDLLRTVSLPILFWMCPNKPLKTLISSGCITSSGFGDWMHEVQPKNGYILYNSTQILQYGAFKEMREGQIDLVGQSPFSSTPASSHGNGNSHTGPVAVALKQPYLHNRNINHGLDSLSSLLSTLPLSPDNQVKELAADSLSIQWAGALLQDVYEFVASYQSGSATLPFAIPQFRFVVSGLAMTNIPGKGPEEKEVFLVEELIRSNGPWRKYINNNSSRPCQFSDNENIRRTEFLAFCQHVQYWRTGGLVFTSDFQGGDTLLTDPQIITHPDLGHNLFSKGNVQRTHRDFEKEHKCNIFCKFFEVPTQGDQLADMPAHSG